MAHESVSLVPKALPIGRWTGMNARHANRIPSPNACLRCRRYHDDVAQSVSSTRSMKSRRVPNGWPLFWLLSALLLLMALACLLVAGFETPGYRLIIRATARTSLALFLAAFLASVVLARWPGSLGHWLVRNRRSFGLAFAMSHAIHLGAIVIFARTDWAGFWALSSKGAIIAGSIAYVVIGLLASTSFDSAVRWLGPRRWKQLHRFGLWFVWLFFVFTNAKRIPTSGWYVVPVVALIAAMIFRLRTLRSRSSRQPDALKAMSSPRRQHSN
jgi:methionine sulfoxide reductase heme-binding subunit